MDSSSDRWRLLSAYADEISAARSTESVIQLTVTAAASALDATTTSIARYGAERGRVMLYLHVAGDDAATPLPPQSMHWGEYAALRFSVADHAMSWHGSLEDEDISAAGRALLQYLDKRHGAGFRVVVADTVWGDLFITRADGEAFNDGDLRVGEVLVGLMSSGLSRLELLADLADLAYTDPLTGIANRRAADEWLERRLTAPGPFVPLAAVLCDINGLKSVNDTFGHSAGDELLRLVSASLTSVVEDVDDALVARMGGDEFLVLFSGIDRDQLGAVEKRLADLDLPHGTGMAVGAAVASHRPPRGESSKSAARSLLRLADAAQYLNKRSRRLGLPTSETPAVLASPVQHSAEAAAWFSECLAALDDLRGEPAVVRLQAVAEILSDAYDVASWWVSDTRDGPLVDVLGRLRRSDFRGALREVELTSGTQFDAADFPATVAALAGGSYYASLTEGDEAERSFLGWMGYVGTLAAGATSANGEQWLLELFADPPTSTSLHTAEATLRALVHLAVRDAVPTPT